MVRRRRGGEEGMVVSTTKGRRVNQEKIFLFFLFRESDEI